MYYNIYNNTKPNAIEYNNKSKESKNFHSDEKLERIIIDCAQRMNSFENLAEANVFFDEMVKSNSLFKKLGNNTYQYKDYFINTGKKYNLVNHAVGLTMANKLGLSSAPLLIGYSDLKNNIDCVLITKIQGCENNPPLPYNENLSKVTLEAKQKLLNDADIMIKNGIFNIDLYNKSYWYYSPEANKIIISNWSDLRGFSQEQQGLEYKKKLSDMLNLIY